MRRSGGKPGAVAAAGLAAALALAAAGGPAAVALAAPAKGSETARQLFDRYRAHLAKSGSFESRCGFDLETEIMGRRAKFEGNGHITVRWPSLMRVETETLKAVGVAGGGPPTVVIQRNARWWKAIVVSQDYLPHYELQRTAAAAAPWVQGVPMTDLVRPPFPPGLLVKGATPEAVRADTLAGTTVQVLTVLVPGHGKTPASRFRWWLEPERLALLRYEMLDDAGKVVSRHEYSEFKDVEGGYRLPGRCAHYGPDGKQDLNCYYYDYRWGVPAADSLFVPEGIPFDPRED